MTTIYLSIVRMSSELRIYMTVVLAGREWFTAFVNHTVFEHAETDQSHSPIEGVASYLNN